MASIDRRRQLVAVRAHGDELDLVAVAEQPRERLPDQEAVVGDPDAHGHATASVPAAIAARRHACGTPACRHSGGGAPSASARKSRVALTRLLTSSV